MSVDALPLGAYPTAMVERLVGACEAIKAVAESWLEQLDIDPGDVVRLTMAAEALEQAWVALAPPPG
jgi:hypothetical protein